MPKLAPPPAFDFPDSPERDALLAAVRADPDDDTPRLVYADWQDEHGQPEHAELIRVQCELGRLRGHAHAAARRPLRDRAKELLRKPAFRFDGTATPAYERGFVPNVGVKLVGSPHFGLWDTRTLRPGRLDLPTRVPLDRVLGLSLELAGERGVTPDVLADLAARPWLTRVADVTLFAGTWEAAKVRALAKSPYLTGVRVLEFWKATVSADAVARLYLAPGLKNVRELLLVNNCTVTAADGEPPSPGAFDAALWRIVNSPRAARMERLWLDTTGVSPAGVRALIDTPRFGERFASLAMTAAVARGTRAALRKRFGAAFSVVG